MRGIPINIQKIKKESFSSRTNKKTESISYLIEIYEKGSSWNRMFEATRDQLIKLRDEIDTELASATTAEILEISQEEAALIDKHYQKDSLCQDCPHKLTFNCKTCLLVLQSPLERKLFLELKKTYIGFETQCPISWKGERVYIDTKSLTSEKVKFHNILTIPDFYIEKRDIKLCIYTDGHTYHERTEDQAKRDRNIDRKLQELGFIVLRYTGKEVNENPQKIIGQIKKWVK